MQDSWQIAITSDAAYLNLLVFKVMFRSAHCYVACMLESIMCMLESCKALSMHATDIVLRNRKLRPLKCSKGIISVILIISEKLSCYWSSDKLSPPRKESKCWTWGACIWLNGQVWTNDPHDSHITGSNPTEVR